MEDRLRLIAQDSEDLQFLAAALQNAVARLGDFVWDPFGRRFTLAANRFRWEAGPGLPSRVRTGIQIGAVLSVQAKRLRQDAKDAVVELLSLTFEPASEPPAGTLILMFAGGGDLRLQVECIDMVLADVSDPWPTRNTPDNAA